MKVIDLRSDTVTPPTNEMRCAMYDAEVGDDVFREDPTINRLEQMAAEMLGKEAGLFTPSGTMSNLIAVLTHAQHGSQILVGSEAHMVWYEVGGASTLGGVTMRVIPNESDGRIQPEAVEECIPPKDIHQAPATLLCLENTHNRCGGSVLTIEFTSAIAQLVHQHGLQVHLDGARIFNAAVALDTPASKLAAPIDSVCFSLSKGLSAPAGSVLCGSREFVEKGRKWRKMLGGGMRQAGVIAAAGIVALQKMVNRLAEDHANAKRLAHGLAHIASITVYPEGIQTNIVVFEPQTAFTAPEFIQRMAARGVKFTYLGGRKVRAVTHRMISTADVDETLNRIELLREN